MNALDHDRVGRARERLEAAARTGAVNDPAVRIVKLNPPIAGGVPVALNRKVTMLCGLSRSGARTLFSTIDGMQRDADRLRSEVEEVDPTLDPLEPRVAERLAIIESCDQALLLSGAEMRGADLVLADLDEKIASALPRQETETDVELSREVSPEFEAFVAQALDSPSDIISIEDGLAALSTDARRVALKAACSLELQPADRSGQTSPGMRLFGSSSRAQTNLIRAEAEGELSEYDMTPGSPAYVLASRLDFAGIATSPLDAAAVATDLLAQIEQAKEDRATYEQSMRELTGSGQELAAERDAVMIRRTSAARRQSTQQHLRRIAHSQLSEHGTRPRGLMPVLIEEPFDALPHDLTTTTLRMLLDYSEIAQIILVSSRSDVRQWCQAMDDRVDDVTATGWFAEEHDGW